MNYDQLHYFFTHPCFCHIIWTLKSNKYSIFFPELVLNNVITLLCFILLLLNRERKRTCLTSVREKKAKKTRRFNWDETWIIIRDSHWSLFKIKDSVDRLLSKSQIRQADVGVSTTWVHIFSSAKIDTLSYNIYARILKSWMCWYILAKYLDYFLKSKLRYYSTTKSINIYLISRHVEMYNRCGLWKAVTGN